MLLYSKLLETQEQLTLLILSKTDATALASEFMLTDSPFKGPVDIIQYRVAGAITQPLLLVRKQLLQETVY
jgi:hypothetical protein